MQPDFYHGLLSAGCRQDINRADTWNGRIRLPGAFEGHAFTIDRRRRAGRAKLDI